MTTKESNSSSVAATAILRMINLDGQVVVTKELEVGDVDDAGLKMVEKAQNEVLAQMGFKGYCKVERKP